MTLPMSAPDSPAPRRLHNACGLAVEWLWHGGLRTITWQGVTLNLFPGSAAEAGPANRWLRLIGDDGQLRTVQALQGSAGIQRQAHTHVVPDLPNVPEGSPRASPGHGSPAAPAMRWEGVFEGLVIEEVLQLAADQPRMAWHLLITNTAAHAQAFDTVKVTPPPWLTPRVTALSMISPVLARSRTRTESVLVTW